MIVLGVLVSGSGTNLQAILDAVAEKRLDARVAVVVSNVAGAGALARAERARRRDGGHRSSRVRRSRLLRREGGRKS